MLGYLVAGSDGSIEPSRRHYNWGWYRALTEAALAEVLTSDSGQQRQYSVPAGALSQLARRELIVSAHRELPSLCTRPVEREPNPFVQAIFDYEAHSMVKGRIALLGDATFVVRPHTAMGVSKAAGDAMFLRDSVARFGTVEQALGNYDAVRCVVGREIAQYGQRLGATFRSPD
jgi:2-polyprenyl-6-methoxyphenol hydroxylase-like FAD-dependent oxidoreductase